MRIKVAKSKKNNPASGADYSNKMRSRYAKKVKTSGKTYTKSDRRENRVAGEMNEYSKEEKLKKQIIGEDVYVEL